jgi:hypothetical protein
MMSNKPWDTAAGTLLAREAGTHVTDARATRTRRLLNNPAWRSAYRPLLSTMILQCRVILIVSGSYWMRSRLPVIF